MLKRWIWRSFVGICFALPMAFLAVAAAQARAPLQDVPANECQDCHEIIQTHWADSAHGQAVSDVVFKQAWLEAGSPGECLSCHTTGYDPATGTWEKDGVTCKVCHYPVSDNHPEVVMPTDISSRLCGTCHLDTYAEWETSTHGQEDLACVRCHNPHTTSLKKSDAQEVCQACHNEETHFFTYTGHAKDGLLCADCHLRVSEAQMGEGHGQRLHTFVVDIGTCTGCHGENLHYPTGNESLLAEPVEASMTLPIGEATVSMVPEPVSPLGFAVVAALVGMGSGIVLAPWLENWYRRTQQSDDTRW
jgi:hypothetical protein